MASVVDLANLRVTEPDVAGLAEDGADGISDLGGFEHCGRHLVQERQERVEIVLVDDRDSHVFVRETAGSRDAGETTADDDHVGQVGEIWKVLRRIGRLHHISTKHS